MFSAPKERADTMPNTEHAHASMHEIEEQYDEVDDSRPFFQRHPREVGIYITVYEAVPVDKKSVGLEHFFRMKTTEILYEEFLKTDTVDIRAELDRRAVLTDMYIDRFEPGIILAVGFDSVETLDALWQMHTEDKLSTFMHDVLITSGDLQAASITDVTLKAKLWEDEYDDCKEELLSSTDTIQNIRNRPNDLKLVQRLKLYQKVVAEEILCMRDMDNEMELNRNEFMNCVRNLVFEEIDRISSLREYEKLARSHKARSLFNKHLLETYLSIIEKWRENYKTFWAEIVMPLKQIHQDCEKEKQRDIKVKVIRNILEMQQMLDADHCLQLVTHPEVEKKVARREYPVFLGLLSLISLGTEKLTDIDILIDDYMREFNLEKKL